MIILKIIGFFFLGLFLLSLIIEILSVPANIFEKIKERWDGWNEEERRTITPEERMKRFEAEKEFMRKHPNVKC